MRNFANSVPNNQAGVMGTGQIQCEQAPVETIAEIINHLNDIAEKIAEHATALGCAIGGPVPATPKADGNGATLPDALRILRGSLANSSTDLGC